MPLPPRKCARVRPSRALRALPGVVFFPARKAHLFEIITVKKRHTPPTRTMRPSMTRCVRVERGSAPALRDASTSTTRVRRTRPRPRAASSDDDGYVEDYNRSPYFTQTAQRFVDLITVQAIKNTLHYLQETNGEMHMYLHAYVVEHPIARETDMDAWLSELASTPLTRVVDPRRSSVPGPKEEEDALRKGRKVSPRDVCERIMACRVEVAKELAGVTDGLGVRNSSVLRKALEATFREYDDVTDFRGEKKGTGDDP